MATTKAHINPAVLRWAREEAGVTEEYLAKKIQTKADNVLEWESGDSFPSMPQLRRLANFLKRPPALFFMNQPPELSPMLADFRRNSHDFPLSAQSRYMIRWAINRRKYAIELSEELEEVRTKDYPIISLSSNPESLAQKVRAFFKLDIEHQINLKKVDDFLKYSIRLLEEKDILVFQTDKVDLAELRGFSLSERPYPSIVLNSDDSHAGRLFTLFHELGHILLQQDGICDLDYDDYDYNINKISNLEVWNNRFSAAILCPETVFKKYSNEIIIDKRQILIAQVEELSKIFLVSREVVARRLLQLGYTDKNTYLAFREKFQKDWEDYKKSKKKKKGESVIIPQKYKIINWNGRKYTRLVLDSLHNKNIGYYEASNYLGIKPKHLVPLARTLYNKEGV
ncbi:MAG TPA: XRE family transcriptional regulator [Spirochaetota bacterium]|nr:XRE family transcriptional regulator [Spirochaetota bacterium]